MLQFNKKHNGLQQNCKLIKSFLIRAWPMLNLWGWFRYKRVKYFDMDKLADMPRFFAVIPQKWWNRLVGPTWHQLAKRVRFTSTSIFITPVKNELSQALFFCNKMTIKYIFKSNSIYTNISMIGQYQSIISDNWYISFWLYSKWPQSSFSALFHII